LSDAKCTLNDVIRLKEIEEMQRLPPLNVHLDPGFIIKQYGSNVTLKFVSVNTDRIIEVNIPPIFLFFRSNVSLYLPPHVDVFYGPRWFFSWSDAGQHTSRSPVHPAKL
jgi:hypothetical protein